MGGSGVDWTNELVIVWRAKSPADSAYGATRSIVEPTEVEVEPPMISGLVEGMGVVLLTRID